MRDMIKWVIQMCREEERVNPDSEHIISRLSYYQELFRDDPELVKSIEVVMEFYKTQA